MWYNVKSFFYYTDIEVFSSKVWLHGKTLLVGGGLISFNVNLPSPVSSPRDSRKHEPRYNGSVTDVLQSLQSNLEKHLSCVLSQWVATIYRIFKQALGKKFTVSSGPDLPQFRLVDMYTKCTESQVRDSIVSSIATEDSNLSYCSNDFLWNGFIYRSNVLFTEAHHPH